MSLARQVLWLQLALVLLLIAPLATIAVLNAQRQADERTRAVVTGIAVSIAEDPNVVADLGAPDPAADLQPYATSVEEITGVDFVVVMRPDRTRITHPTPSERGGSYIGTVEQALAGEIHTEEYEGTLGPSIRTIAPVESPTGEVVALVSVGRTRERIGDQVQDQLPWIAAVMVGGFLVGVAGSWLVSRRLRRQTAGLGARELRAMYDHHDAVLHSIREGLLVYDAQGRVALANDEARRLLDLPEGDVDVDDLPPSLRRPAPTSVSDDVHLTESRVLVISQQAVDRDGSTGGQVVTIRDRTELQGVMGELDSVRSFAESLRSRAHESANRLHTVITMVEMGRPEEAVAFATRELDLSQALIDRLMRDIEEPALAALLLGKASQADERGVRLQVTDESELESIDPLTSHEVITIVGNLIDNAIDAVAGHPGAGVAVTVRREEDHLLFRVTDSGDGMPAVTAERAFERGFSTKSSGRGLGLALVAQTALRHRGEITVDHDPSAVTVTVPVGDPA